MGGNITITPITVFNIPNTPMVNINIGELSDSAYLPLEIT